ncbi:MAG: GIY-YIG nuclease family protein [Paracoccaceae bacterium]|nr:GIY-YIG nuclease family protein [Paracoccaceae bacterium]
MPNQGFIYILTNSVDINAVKVGRTTDLKRRLNQHNNPSNVVGIWSLHWSINVPDMLRAEGLALESLSQWKVPGRREQFHCGPEKAEKEISVALAEWSNWGSEEKVRRQKRDALEQEARRRAHKIEEQAKVAQKRRKADEETFEMLCHTYAERKVAYERAKRILAGTERIPYPFKLNDLCLFTLLALGIYYYVTGTGPWEWARLPVAVAYFYGLFAFIDAQTRFSEWRKAQDHNSYLGTIENFETVYPDGIPPKSVNDLWHLERLN